MALKPASSPGLGARLFAPGTPGGLALLRAAWPNAVGPELAQRTEVTGIDRGTLRVRVPDARWRQGLFRMRHRILARLRETAGPAAPDRLGFVEGPVSAPVPTAAATEPPAVPKDAPPDVAAAAEAISDPDLRARFLETAARYLDRFGGT
jgi:hypothetical protein